MGPASEETLIRFVRVLDNLAARHGLSNFRLAGGGMIIADVTPGMT